MEREGGGIRLWLQRMTAFGLAELEPEYSRRRALPKRTTKTGHGTVGSVIWFPFNWNVTGKNGGTGK